MFYLLVGFIFYFLGRFEKNFLNYIKNKFQKNSDHNKNDDFFDNEINDKKDFIKSERGFLENDNQEKTLFFK